MLAMMREHIERLCHEHRIAWYQDVKRCERAWAVNECEEIHTPPIRSAVAYATALHEIGHILGRHQDSRVVLVRERWAWRWARRHAIAWTRAMERSYSLTLTAQRGG